MRWPFFLHPYNNWHSKMFAGIIQLSRLRNNTNYCVNAFSSYLIKSNSSIPFSTFLFFTYLFVFFYSFSSSSSSFRFCRTHRKKADLNMEGQFLIRQIYDDEITYNLIGAAVEILSKYNLVRSNGICQLFIFNLLSNLIKSFLKSE